MSNILHTFYVAGLQHHTEDEDLEQIEEGIEVLLMFDPENEYDSDAIQVLYPGLGQIGFVPKKINEEVGETMLFGPHWAEVFRFNPDADPWKMVKIAIYEEEETS